ncbi:glycyl-tRNA synthetase [Scopulibacillus darangshiensis]|uniref:Glycine--tRNA ligase n=1 Tax=Scopulibacillus darangshiensis TaxID=442528 RepID=A0A4R2NFS2_9BACL|nr:glycine--tRNA ligase [Scopulibacillus darangshiensis]TCP20022.1 glycyl-tRNA synthetase [Scopulibacillus darangshiensis]
MGATMEQIVNLAKQRGFIFPGSEIYGGLANTWDYGPLGAELKNNVKKAWWKKFVQESPYNVGLDSSILMNPKTWQASGHLTNFNDPMMDCKKCKSRFRADKLIEAQVSEEMLPGPVDGLSFDDMEKVIKDHDVKCPECGEKDFTSIRQFNLMFKTFQGVTETSADEIYLRPETAQGIFVNFKNVQRTMRKKLPFGIAQIGKSFRNEITPGNFTYRTREFEQLELEFFCKPGEEMEWFDFWRTFSRDWLVSLNMKEDNVRLRDHEKEELPHYSNATTDIEYQFPFGWGELSSLSSRTDFDLKRHMEVSGEDMQYIDQESNERYLPYVVEPSIGADRVTLSFLIDAFEEEQIGENDSRHVLRLHPALAPYKAAILPLSKKLKDEAQGVYKELAKHHMVDYDETGSIGKRYRRQDEVGTPFCITYDFDSREDGKVTVRDRDTMEQVRCPISELNDFLNNKLVF